MIELSVQKLAPAVRRFRWIDRAGALTQAQVLDILHHAGDDAAHFSAMILAPGFDAVFWEMPPLSSDRVDDVFECVVVDAPALTRMRADPGPFCAHFRAGRPVSVFENLGGDACLVAPAPVGDADFTHLAAFCRNASNDLQRQFFSTLAGVAMQRLDARPLWVSTSGLGVGWLHARLDSRPKYYTHAVYRRWP